MDDIIYLIGGNGGVTGNTGNKVLAINITNGAMEYKAETTNSHWIYHTCASMSNGNKTFIVITGQSYVNTEIFDIEENKWEQGMYIT